MLQPSGIVSIHLLPSKVWRFGDSILLFLFIQLSWTAFDTKGSYTIRKNHRDSRRNVAHYIIPPKQHHGFASFSGVSLTSARARVNALQLLDMVLELAALELIRKT